MVNFTRLNKSLLSLILIVAFLLSNIVGYTPVHAASDAYSLTEAESFGSKSGAYLKVENCPDGGQSIGGTNDNQYLAYKNIDFGSGANGATKFSARLSVKGSNAGGNIEIRLDSPTGPLAGTLTVAATAPDNWNVYQTQSTDIANVTGTHDVYLEFKVAAGKTYVANLNWFQFSKTLNEEPIELPLSNKDMTVTGDGAKMQGGAKAFDKLIDGMISESSLAELKWGLTGNEGISLPLPVDFNFTKPQELTKFIVYNRPQYTNGKIKKLSAKAYTEAGKEYDLGANTVQFNDKSVTFNLAEAAIPSGTKFTKITIIFEESHSGPLLLSVAEVEVFAKIKPKILTSITAPAVIKDVVNGTVPTAAALGLPSKVALVTDGGNVDVPVTWNIADSGYDPAVKTEQNFTITGTLDLPAGIANPNNLALSTSINVTVLVSTTPEKDTSYKFSFMAISDTHAGVSGDENDVTLNNALQDAISNNVQSVSVVGDLTQNGTDAQYNTFMKTMNKYPQLDRNYALGNHDVRWMGGFETAEDRFLSHTGMPSVYFDKWIDGYHFIYLGTEADDKDSAYLSDTQLKWLEAKLAEGAKKDTPIFLFVHQPLGNTVSMTKPEDSYQSDEVQDQKFKDIVGKYPQSVLITGHVHDDIRLPGTLYNKQYFTMIRDGAINYNPSYTKEPGAQGLIFDIYADRVVINGRDFATKSTIATWTINNYTGDALAADKQAPTAPTNVTTKVLTDNMVNLSWDAATDNFKGNVGVTGYDIYNGDTLIGSTTGRTNFKITGLTPNTTYQFNVKAKDEAGNVSEFSSPLKVTTLGYDPAPVNLTLNKTVTSNGSVAGYEESNVVDGSASSGSKWSSNTNGDKWLMVDLGQNYDISRWVVKHAGEGGDSLSLNTKNYKLQGSLDGTTWTDLDSVTGNVSNVTDRYITKSNVRYVRLYITTPQNYNETGTANIYEFEVYGREDDVQPPVTTATTDGVIGEDAWNAKDVNVKFTTEDDPPGTGVNRIETRVDSGDWTNKTELTLTADGMHSVEYRAIDNAGNVEAVKHLAIGIDKTAPAIAVSVPGDGSIYENSGDIKPQFALTDYFSGVDNSKTAVTIDMHSYKIGTTISLYTLSLGQHTLVISSSDLVGNQVSKTVHFQTVASIDSLKTLVTRFADTKWIDNAGIANSLQAKLKNNDLNSFVNQVKAQNGKHISSEAATYLLRDAQYVLSQQ